MKIAIISDTHNNITNIDTTLAYILRQKIKTIIHCGDISSKETLRYFIQHFPGEIYAVTGNASDDIEDLKSVIKREGIEIESDFGAKVFNSIHYAWCHYPERARELGATKKYDIIFYGHTHKPWEEKIKTYNQRFICLVNPGTVAGMLCRATFAIYDTKIQKAELIILDQL